MENQLRCSTSSIQPDININKCLAQPHLLFKCPHLLLSNKETQQEVCLMMSAGHDGDKIICQGQFHITVNSLFASCVCGHAMLHRNVVGLDNTLNFFHCFMTNKQPNNYTATKAACFHMLFVSLRRFYRLRKINILTHMWHYPKVWYKCSRSLSSIKNQKKNIQFCIKMFCAKSFLSNYNDCRWKLHAHFESFTKNQKKCMSINRMELLMKMVESSALRLYWTCAISKGNPLNWLRLQKEGYTFEM